MAGSDITVEILKDIRDEIRVLRTDTNTRLDGHTVHLMTIESALHAHTQRFEVIESTLLDLAEQQRFVVRYTKATSERDSRLEPRVSDLETRVGKLESK